MKETIYLTDSAVSVEYVSMKRYTEPKKELKKIRKELKGIDELFAAINKDKKLPTFGEFYMLCLVLGNAECVNLKKMYPALHRRLNLKLNKYIARGRKLQKI